MLTQQSLKGVQTNTQTEQWGDQNANILKADDTLTLRRKLISDQETGTGQADHHLPPAHRALWSERTGIADTSLCEQGQADQTSDHVLQSCPKHAERRLLIWRHSADLATKLWGSAEDLYRTAGLWHQPD